MVPIPIPSADTFYRRTPEACSQSRHKESQRIDLLAIPWRLQSQRLHFSFRSRTDRKPRHRPAALSATPRPTTRRAHEIPASHRGIHRRPEHSDRPLDGLADPVLHADQAPRRHSALCLRLGLERPAGSAMVHVRPGVPVLLGLDPAGGRPCPHRYPLLPAAAGGSGMDRYFWNAAVSATGLPADRGRFLEFFHDLLPHSRSFPRSRRAGLVAAQVRHPHGVRPAQPARAIRDHQERGGANRRPAAAPGPRGALAWPNC